MCGIQLKDGRKTDDLMLILVLTESTHQLAMAQGVCWYGSVFRLEDGHFWSMTLVCKVEGRRKGMR